MSNWTVHLEFAEGTSSKFWRARVEGGTLYVNYGKIGSAGQTQVKDFGTADAANREYDKLVREKRKKGYVDAGTGGGGAGAGRPASRARTDAACGRRCCTCRPATRLDPPPPRDRQPQGRDVDLRRW